VSRLPDGSPPGLVYRREFLSIEEESQLLAELDGLRFDPIVMHGQPARRTARHFGVGYDYDARRPQSAEPLPDWLEGPRARAAALARVEPDDLVEALAQRYPVGSTIGWHRDAPAFGRVVGISVAGACRLRFRPVRDTKRVWEVALEPRSAYVLRGASRWSWQHSIPATKEERYSLTFRSLR
jgi:DNA oxidative demethylase